MSGSRELCNVVVLGESGVGKTQITKRMALNKYLPNSPSTVGVEFVSKEIKTKNGDCHLQIWDTPASEHLAFIVAGHYKDKEAFIFVYDVTNSESLQKIKSRIEHVQENISKQDDPLMILLGNKTDLTGQREVSEEAARQFAKENGIIIYGEVSAKESVNLDDLPEKIITEVKKKTENNSADNHDTALSRIFGGSVGTVFGGAAAIGFTLLMASLGPVGWVAIGVAAAIVVAGTVCGVLGSDVVREHQAAVAELESDKAASTSTADMHRDLGIKGRPEEKKPSEEFTNPEAIARDIELGPNFAISPYESSVRSSDQSPGLSSSQ